MDSRVFPETQCAVDIAPDANIGYISSSEAVGCGHEDSMNRLPDPNVEWATGPATPENVVANENTPPSTAR